MTLRDVLKDLVAANRKWYCEMRVRRLVARQADYRASELYKVVHASYDPCFVLSTGRTGTKMLEQILALQSDVESVHEPSPSLSYHGPYAYRNRSDPSRHEELRSVIDATRYDMVRDAFLVGKKFVQTGHQDTFFASQLAELYSQSRFIHLIREPTAFVESGLARGWYTDRVITDEARIRPDAATLDRLRIGTNPSNGDLPRDLRIRMIAWLWNETNHYIESFKSTLDNERHLTIRSEDFFGDPATSVRLLAFIGAKKGNAHKIAALLRKPQNPLKKGSRTRLSERDKAEILAETPLAARYYPIDIVEET